MASYSIITPDGISIRGNRMRSGAVLLNDVYAGLTMSAEDSYKLGFDIRDYALDAGAGPFTIFADMGIGDQFVTLNAGNGANLNVGDVVILTDTEGKISINKVDASHSGTDTVPLEERLTREVLFTSTIERAGRLEIQGVEGRGSSGTSSFTEVIWLTDVVATGGATVSRIRLDPSSSYTVSTFDFTASDMEITEYFDAANLHRYDRRTRFNILAFAIAPIATATPFSTPHLAWASGHRSNTKTLPTTIDRYAEQHPPVRISVTVIFGTDFSGGVFLEGFRTVWSPIRENYTGGTSNLIKISPENLDQFAVGDPVTFYDLATDTNETLTVTLLVPPDQLQVSATIVNNYNMDDIVGIVQTENISVAAGVGTYYSIDGWVYPLFHNTAGGSENFIYQMYRQGWGYHGGLHTVDHRRGSGVSGTTSLRQNDGVYQSSTAKIIGSSVRFFGGGVGGATILPRPTDVWQAAGSEYRLFFGGKDAYRNSTSGHYMMRGSADKDDELWRISTTSDTTVGLHAQGLTVAPRKLVEEDDAGRASWNDTDTNWTARDCRFETRGLSKNTADFPDLSNIVSVTDSAGDYIPQGTDINSVGIQVDASERDFRHLNDFGGGRAGVQCDPATDLGLSNPVIVRNYGSGRDNARGRGSGLVELIGVSTHDIRLRCIDCWFDQVKMASPAAGGTKEIESGFSLSVKTVNANNEPIPFITVAVYREDGTTKIFDTQTDINGRIYPQEVMSHNYSADVGGSSPTWRVGDAVPGDVTLTEYGPFWLVLLGDIFGGTGAYEPKRIKLTPLPFMREPYIIDVVMEVPRAPGMFGTGGTGGGY